MSISAERVTRMSQTYIIAELACSHDGSVELAKKIIDAAADAGADAMSMHLTYMPDYMVRHYGTGPGRVSAGKDTKPIYEYLCELLPTFDVWPEIVDHAKSRGLDVIMMPNDQPSLNFAKTLEPAALVLSAACFEEYDFIANVGRAELPVFLRVGGATLGEMETVIGILRKNNCSKITLLYGHQNYPTAISETNIAFLSCLQQTFGLPVGLADHVDADEDFAGIAPLLAIPLGATCIEKHITFDRSAKGEDFESALNPDEFELMVTRIRQAESAMGLRHAEGLDESSAFYRRNVRKRIVAARDIKAGKRIEREDIATKRTDEGASPVHIDYFVGRIATDDIPMDKGLEFDSVRPGQ